MVENDKPTKNRLRVRRVVDVPLREVSGICLRRGRRSDVSDCSRRPCGEDRLVFPAAQRWGPNRLAYRWIDGTRMRAAATGQRICIFN